MAVLVARFRKRALPLSGVRFYRARTMLNYELDGKVAVVTMDDGKANALSVAMIDGLLDALARARRRASAMVLAGRPDKFCAGFDLRA